MLAGWGGLIPFIPAFSNDHDMGRCRSLAFLILLDLFSVQLQAQRMIPGQWVLSAGAGAVPAGDVPCLVDVSFDRLGYGTRMACRASGLFSRGIYPAASAAAEGGTVGYDVHNSDVYASWGFLFDAAHSRSRAAVLWLGATADMGARVRSVVAGAGGVPGAGLLLGVTPEASAEFFVAPRSSLGVYFRPHMHWVAGDGTARWFWPAFGARFNVYMFVGR